MMGLTSCYAKQDTFLQGRHCCVFNIVTIKMQTSQSIISPLPGGELVHPDLLQSTHRAQDCRNIDSALNCVIIVLLDSYLYNSVLVPFQLVFSTILH